MQWQHSGAIAMSTHDRTTLFSTDGETFNHENKGEALKALRSTSPTTARSALISALISAAYSAASATSFSVARCTDYSADRHTDCYAAESNSCNIIRRHMPCGSF